MIHLSVLSHSVCARIISLLQIIIYIHLWHRTIRPGWCHGSLCWHADSSDAGAGGGGGGGGGDSAGPRSVSQGGRDGAEIAMALRE